MNNNIVIEKFRLFFKDLIVLGRETLWCYEKNLVMPLIYELFENLDENKWYHFYYDIKLKKWILISYKNTNSVIFNPTYKNGINEFLTIFSIEDLKLAHYKLEQIYKLYSKLK